MILSMLGALILITFAALMLISGVFQKPFYLQPWKKDYATALTDPRLQLAAHGLLAASGHNMQPWIIRLDEKDEMVFSLYADSERLSPAADPDARQLMISQGTFLEYVRIAGEKLGYMAVIKLFPKGEYDETRLEESMNNNPVAQITLSRTEAVNHPLYPYLFQPDTNRGAFRSDPLTLAQQEELQTLSTEEDLQVVVLQDQENRERLTNYIKQAAVIEAGVGQVMDESAQIFRANEREKNKYRYGFSVEGQGTTGWKHHMLQGLVTLFPSLNKGQAAEEQFLKSIEASVNSTPAFALILSGDNSRTSQVRSGMLYSRLILAAHEKGLAMQPLSQAIEEYPEMDRVYSGIHGSYASGGQTIQMLVRVGMPVKEAPLSMRRDVRELIDSGE